MQTRTLVAEKAVFTLDVLRGPALPQAYPVTAFPLVRASRPARSTAIAVAAPSLAVFRRREEERALAAEAARQRAEAARQRADAARRLAEERRNTVTRGD